VELSIKERLILIHVLPKEGNVLTLKIVRKLREDLSFSEAEHKEFKITQTPDGVVSWDDTNTTKKNVEIGEKATDIIIDGLKDLDKRKKLTEDHLPIWEMFINESS